MRVTLAVCAGVLTLALAGCGTGGYVSEGSPSNGERLFKSACTACHALADAGSTSTIGPNLDDAFAQARADGMSSDTFVQVVADQVRFPITMTSTGQPGMPNVDGTMPDCDDVAEDAFCVEDQDQAVQDVAVYVGSVAGTGEAPEAPTDGRSIFLGSCGTCHTLADAGTTGTVGPNLDESRPSKELAIDRVTNGRGVMPPFEDSLSPEQIEAVAEYVSSVAGR